MTIDRSRSPHITRPIRSRSLRRLPSVELLESRLVPTTFTVTSLADSGAGSLREAITEANADPSQDTILFDSSVKGQITLLTALPDISSDVVLNGPGSASLTVARDPTKPEFRIFQIPAGVHVAISGLTLKGAAATGQDGGAILSSGTLRVTSTVITGNSGVGAAIANLGGAVTLTNSTISNNFSQYLCGAIKNVGGTFRIADCVITGNSAYGLGGAIVNLNSPSPDGSPSNDATMTITDTLIRGNSTADSGGAIVNVAALSIARSTVTGNSAMLYGGGIYNLNSLLIADSTISDNQVRFFGGGLYCIGEETVHVVNSTFSGNSAGFAGGILPPDTVAMPHTEPSPAGGTPGMGNGGAIFLLYQKLLTLSDCTVASNTVTNEGSGIYVDSSTLDVQATIFDNVPGDNLAVLGTINSLGHNLFSDQPQIDLAHTDLVNTDPRLGPLADNGGPTMTRALLAGSPAIDAGVAIAGVTADQRGVSRLGDSSPDIGAFEFRVQSIILVGGDHQSADVGTVFDEPLKVRVIDPFGNPVPDVPVLFTPPTVGASATLIPASVLTGADGTASVVASANEFSGTYAITTSANGVYGPAFTLTNMATPPPPPPPPVFPTPTVLTFQRLGVHLQPTSLVVRFSEEMDAGRAGNLSNYRIVSAGRDGKLGTKDDRTIRLRGVQYDPATRTVWISPKPRLPLNSTYQITVTGTPPGGLTSTRGVYLGGAGADRPGTDYVAIFGRNVLVQDRLLSPSQRMAAARNRSAILHPKPSRTR